MSNVAYYALSIHLKWVAVPDFSIVFVGNAIRSAVGSQAIINYFRLLTNPVEQIFQIFS